MRRSPQGGTETDDGSIDGIDHERTELDEIEQLQKDVKTLKQQIDEINNRDWSDPKFGLQFSAPVEEKSEGHVSIDQTE